MVCGLSAPREGRATKSFEFCFMELISSLEFCTIQKLCFWILTSGMEDNLDTMVAEHKLVPLVLSAWRAFTRTSILERKAISRSALLDKMLEALPWWIRKVRDRRQLERSFFQWLVLQTQSPTKTASTEHSRLSRGSLTESKVWHNLL